MKELKDFDTAKEDFNLKLLLDKYPFDFIMESIYHSCMKLSDEYEREKNYKLMECFHKNAESIEHLLKVKA